MEIKDFVEIAIKDIREAVKEHRTYEVYKDDKERVAIIPITFEIGVEVSEAKGKGGSASLNVVGFSLGGKLSENNESKQYHKLTFSISVSATEYKTGGQKRDAL
ncbi:MAG: hypothetical protein LBT79_01670 [Elusimicrobiota bacterium]|jgi:hypothetical protein|nr:hypothetical protein [Elusimicrobiota bacterium]